MEVIRGEEKEEKTTTVGPSFIPVCEVNGIHGA